MRRQPRKIGSGIVCAGRVRPIRGQAAARHPEVEWIGIAEKNPARATLVAETVGAEFVTSDFRELLKRPEVNAAVISTDEHLHVHPVLAGVERGIPVMIEKPQATASPTRTCCWRRSSERKWTPTNSWLNRVSLGVPTQHATAREGHDRLMLTKAIDLSARLKRAITLPITPGDEVGGRY